MKRQTPKEIIEKENPKTEQNYLKFPREELIKIKMNPCIKKQIKWIIMTWIIIAIGLVLFKYLPMQIYGKEILFDASSHIVWTSFAIYVLWFFVDQNKSWKTPYFIFSAAVLIIMSIQRIITKQHNEVGIMLGFVVVGLAILIPRWKEFKKRLKF